MRHLFFSFPLLLLMGYSASIQASVPAATSAEQRLRVRLDSLLTQPSHAQDEIVRTAELLATPAQLAAVCDNPELTLAGNDNRVTGKRTVIAQCGKRKHYLPIRISAQGRWWIARQNLATGTVLQHSDIEAIVGKLDGQPGGLVFNANQIIGQRLTRAVSAGKPLRQNQLRQQWHLHAGQTVDLVTVGEGFRIRSQGKALNNAAVDGMLKVQMRNGQTLQGKVDADGQVMIFLR